MCGCNKGTAAATPYTVTWPATGEGGEPEVQEFASRPGAILAMAERPGGTLKAGKAPAPA